MHNQHQIKDSFNFTQEELEGIDEWVLSKMVEKYRGGLGIYPTDVYRFRTHEEANE